MNCKSCNNELVTRGMRKRLIRGENGAKIWIRVDQYYCPNCHKYSRALPSDVLPFRQYPKSVIKAGKEGRLDDDERYEDYPCDLTKKRWKKSQVLQSL